MRTLLCFLALLFTGCSAAVPGGWVGRDPKLYVTPSAHEHEPLFTKELVLAARAYCQRGHRCAKVYIGHGQNEVRVTQRVSRLGKKWDAHTIAVVQRKGAKRVLYVIREDGEGRSIRLVPHKECDRKKRLYSARVVALHEMGHFLGFDHVSDPKHIMYPYHLCEDGLKLP